jgi:hypothetical protein
MRKLFLITVSLFFLGEIARADDVDICSEISPGDMATKEAACTRIITSGKASVETYLMRAFAMTFQYSQEKFDPAITDFRTALNPPNMIETTLAIIKDVKRTCAAKNRKSTEEPADEDHWKEEAEQHKNIKKWEKESRREVPKVNKKVPVGEAMVRGANSLLKGNPTCSNMLKAAKLLDKAGDKYSNANAKEAGDGTLRSLARRSAWLEDLAERGECKK